MTRASTHHTLRSRLEWLAGTAPDKPFLVAPGPQGGTCTTAFGDFRELVGRVSGLLASLGVGKGDAVHVQVGNRPEAVACLFGAAELGAVVVPTSRSATLDDVAYITSHAGCRISIVGAEHVPLVRTAQDMVPEVEHVLAVGGPVEGTTDFDSAVAAADPPQRARAVRQDDVVAVLYTSGTTGWPKGVMLTNGNLMFAGEAVASLLRIRDDDRWLVTLPLSHMNALGYSTMSAFYSGASVAIVPDFEPTRWISDCRRFDATLTSLFAVHARKVLAGPPRDDDRHGGPRVTLFAQQLTAAERHQFEQRFGTGLIQVYGLTETIAPTLSDPLLGIRRPTTVGRPTLWSEVRVVLRSGQAAPVGVAGELLVRGEPGRSLMAGYYRRPDETAATMTDGWLRTGDRMLQEPDGYYRFLGRSSDVIKPGADNVSALEVERVLDEHASVVDAAVMGVRDEAGDESIVAYVVLRPEDDATPAEILAWGRERLAEYKVPSRVVQVEEFPRNEVGKVVKHRLPAMAELASTSGDVVVI